MSFIIVYNVLENKKIVLFEYFRFVRENIYNITIAWDFYEKINRFFPFIKYGLSFLFGPKIIYYLLLWRYLKKCRRNQIGKHQILWPGDFTLSPSFLCENLQMKSYKLNTTHCDWHEIFNPSSILLV
jgi:hypothetical protein